MHTPAPTARASFTQGVGGHRTQPWAFSMPPPSRYILAQRCVNLLLIGFVCYEASIKIIASAQCLMLAEGVLTLALRCRRWNSSRHVRECCTQRLDHIALMLLCACHACGSCTACRHNICTSTFVLFNPSADSSSATNAGARLRAAGGAAHRVRALLVHDHRRVEGQEEVSIPPFAARLHGHA